MGGGLCGAAFGQTQPLRLIAHRGGIVDEAHAENSKGSIEVDVRATMDGEPVLQHDAMLELFYSVKQRPEDLSWKEVSALKAQPGGTSPIHFDELCQLAKGRIRLMLDIKNSTMPVGFYEGMARSMTKAGLIEGSYMLGGDKWRGVFGVLGTERGRHA